MTAFAETFVGLYVTVEFYGGVQASGTVRALGDGILILDDVGGTTHAIPLTALNEIVYATPQE